MRKTIEIDRVRKAVANYIRHVGCGCCRDHDEYDKAKKVLAKMLNVPMFDDKSGYDFYQFMAPREQEVVVSDIAKKATVKCHGCKWIEREGDKSVAQSYCDCMQSDIEDIDWDSWKEELAEEDDGLCPEFQEE